MGTPWLGLAGLLGLSLAVGCGGTGGSTSSTSSPSGSNSVEGAIQKGPFLKGSPVTLIELDSNLRETGKTYTTTTTNDEGSFAFTDQLDASYVEVVTSGKYYDEVSGKVTSTTLTLRSLADLSSGATSNINILTHLTRDRIIKLVQEEGKTFSVAKKQAEEELAKVLNMASEVDNFEKLNISGTSTSDAALLAASVMLQEMALLNASSTDPTDKLATYISSFRSDIEADGSLDDSDMKSKMKEASKRVNIKKVTSNLEERFQEITNTKIEIPTFGNYIDSDGDGKINKKSDSQPLEAELIGSYNTTAQIDSVLISGNGTRLYVAGWVGDSGNGFEILDISGTISSPTRLGGWRGSRGAHAALALSSSGNRAYVGHVSDGLVILDISNENSPTELGRYNAGFNMVKDVVLSSDNNTAYLAAGDNGLKILNVSDPTSISLLGSYDVQTNCKIYGQAASKGNCSAAGIAYSASNKIVYVASHWGGVKIVDVSDSTSPTLVTEIEISSGVGTFDHVALSSDSSYLFIVGSAGSGIYGLSIYDVRNPASPALVSRYQNDGAGYLALKLSTNQKRLYISGSNNGMEILDISSFASPTYKGSFHEVFSDESSNVIDGVTQKDRVLYITGLALTSNDRTAFLAGGIYGLRIIRLPE